MSLVEFRAFRLRNGTWQLQGVEGDGDGYPLATVEFHNDWAETIIDAQRRLLLIAMVGKAINEGMPT